MSSFYSVDELQELGLKSVGKNVLISRKASIYGASNIEIGSNVRIDDFCILSGKIKLGNYVHIAAYTALYGGETGIRLEDFVGVSSRNVIYAESDDYSGNLLTNPMTPDKYKKMIKGEVVLKKHVLVGTGTSTMPGVIIGEGCAVGSMSLVNRSLEEWGIYVGIPCRRIKDRAREVLRLEEEMMKSM